MKKAIVTGAHGFLGRNVASRFNRAGYEVHGIGLGPWSDEAPADFGIKSWSEAEITVKALREVQCKPDVVVHCAGSGSVGFSLTNPYDDFKMTVGTTAAVLEYLRTSAPRTRLLYPSSAAVYGCMHDGQISETSIPNPSSPYGSHKLIAEQLCLSSSQNFGLDCRIIRFFSLYGPGLRKQLLWEASRRLTQADNGFVEFFGSGSETRDWLHVQDAAALMLAVAEQGTGERIVNGGSGRSYCVREVLGALRDSLGREVDIRFNHQVRTGDPEHLQADMTEMGKIAWQPEVSLLDGLREYAEWYMQIGK